MPVLVPGLHRGYIVGPTTAMIDTTREYMKHLIPRYSLQAREVLLLFVSVVPLRHGGQARDS